MLATEFRPYIILELVCPDKVLIYLLLDEVIRNATLGIGGQSNNLFSGVAFFRKLTINVSANDDPKYVQLRVTAD